MDKRDMIVTIDGPAGSGKSTTASLLSERLGFTYLDTGAMYRAVTWAALSRGIDPADEAAVSAVAEDIDLEFRDTASGRALILDGRDIGREIRTMEVSSAVSPVSRHKGVRRAMVRLQRKLASGGGVVAEGRDTGSTVFPAAEFKVFLTADIEARARRRVAQLEGMGMAPDIGEIRANIAERDMIDSSRPHSPLRRPPGSFVVDTSGITIEEQVRLIEEGVREESRRLAGLEVQPGEENEYARRHLYWSLSRGIVYIVFRVVFGLKVSGREHLRYRENFIFASNHISYADPPLAGCAVNREVSFMAKSELFRNRFFAWLIRKYHAFPVRRGAADIRSIKEISTRLEEGKSVLLFPEGTRSRTGKMGRLKSGLGMVALSTGRSIVPVLIRGADHLGRCLLRKEKLKVMIGAPVRILPGYESTDRRRDYETLADMVAESLRMMDEEEKA